jgi:HD-GYP domain-containing protein (c-di-GMP phosphodiesterase class II)
VCTLLVSFARGLGLERSIIKEVAIGGLLHDVGKAKVPDDILNKPAKLTEAEFSKMKSHVVQSIVILQNTPGVSQIALDVAGQHHERFDGKGYPDGLAGEAIPWPARCLAVAVGFVESGLGKTAAIDAILAQSGRAYDPDAVRLFLKVSNLVQLPRQVREIMLNELEAGMVLANGIYSPLGLLLIGEGQALSPTTIAKIKSHHRVTPISQRLLVYS